MREQEFEVRISQKEWIGKELVPGSFRKLIYLIPIRRREIPVELACCHKICVEVLKSVLDSSEYCASNRNK